MIVIGAGGHAKEIAGILYELKQTDGVFFYDDVTPNIPSTLFNQFKILRSEREAREVLQNDPRFILGIGTPKHRSQLAAKFEALGGVLTSVISPRANIGVYGVEMGHGLNIMTGAVITQDISIGKGTLVHIQSSIHHDSRIGEFCELQPGCHILGHVKIGSYTSIGSGAIVLPRVTVGNNVTVGAGAVVTKDVKDGLTVKGVPAK